METFDFFYVIGTKRLVYSNHISLDAINLQYALEMLSFYLRKKHPSWLTIMMRCNDFDYRLSSGTVMIRTESVYEGKK